MSKSSKQQSFNTIYFFLMINILRTFFSKNVFKIFPNPESDSMKLLNRQNYTFMVYVFN